jgi:ubiquinone/menaquinone biosynthesis C-methylase UbiE|tara:strand:- start:146 stop:778 length:633 start_codon:yes stop_codon:yes gene_type:complete
MNKVKGLNIYNNLNLDKTKNDFEIKKVYQDWAVQYDKDNDDLLGTVSQPNAVDLLNSHMNDKNIEIVDIGCGTGLVGKFLQNKGYLYYDGLDISEEMLEIAKSRGYRHLSVGSLQHKLPYENDTYDAVFCVGVFTHGHVNSNGLDELIRITKKDGFIIFTINEGVYEDYQFDKKIPLMEKEGLIKVIYFEKKDYMAKKNVMGYYCLAQKI